MVLNIDSLTAGDRLKPKDGLSYSNYHSLKHLKSVELLGKKYPSNAKIIKCRIIEGKSVERCSGLHYYTQDIIELNIDHMQLDRPGGVIPLTRENIELMEILIPNGIGKQSNYFSLKDLEEIKVVQTPTLGSYEPNYFKAKIVKGKTFNNYFGNNYSKGDEITVDLKNFMRKTPKRTQIPFAIWF